MVNKNQEIAIKRCISVLNNWLTTNDINSPSHYTLIDEHMFDLEDDTLDGTNPELVGKTLIDLLNVIKHFK